MVSYHIDNSHSDIGFSVRHMVFARVRGHFERWSAELVLDTSDLTRSSVNVSIDSDSIDTRESKRDAHLRSPDFLDAEKFPKIMFKSTRVAAAGDKHYRVTGNLTIHGVTREVALEVEELGRGKDPWGHDRVAFSAKTTVRRADYGLKWNQALEAGGVLVGEQVDVEIDIEAVASAGQ